MEATRITDRLYKYINEHDGKKLKVHSIFSHALNMEDDKGLLISLLSSQKDLTPMSMVLSTPLINRLPIEIGQVCSIENGHIKINNKLKIGLDHASVHSLKMAVIDTYIRDDDLNTLKNFIADKSHGDGISELVDFIDFGSQIQSKKSNRRKNEYASFIESRLVSLLNKIRFREKDINQSVEKIIGFGPGLTPSTDDFLVGLLTIQYIHDLKGFCKVDLLERVIGKTTKVSEEMIKHVLEGYINETYLTLVDALYHGEAALIDSLNKVTDIGETSGKDYLFGLYSMAMIRNITKEA